MGGFLRRHHCRLHPHSAVSVQLSAIANLLFPHDRPRPIVLSIPAMGTGMAANLGPMYGIYMTFFPGIAYAFLGSSFHNSIGAFAPSAALVGVAVARTRAIFPGNYLSNEAVEIGPEAQFVVTFRQHVESTVGVTFMAGVIPVDFLVASVFQRYLRWWRRS